ncbi:MAG: glycosyltransferase family 39 protein [Nitrospira sp.]|nr:glycosyltransferase family 39 protein [Nitrospira sp.]
MRHTPSPTTHTTPTRRRAKPAKRLDPASDSTERGDTPGPRLPLLTRWGGLPYILTLWAVSRLILTVVGVVAKGHIQNLSTPGNVQRYFDIGTGQVWLDIWIAWDARWYYTIADVGYQAAPPASGGSVWAFFPLYPWVIQAVDTVVRHTPVAALLVSNAFLLLGAWFLYRLVEQHHDRAMARRAVLFLFLFPTAYVFSCLMTESTFFALSVGAWYYARRGNWLLAGVLGMGSAMTRLVGVLMAPLLALEYLRQRQWRLTRIRPDALWIGLVPAGLGVFMAFCYVVTGNPLQFAEVQKMWTPTRENPLWVLWWSLKPIWEGRLDLAGGEVGYSYGAIVTIIVIGVLLWGRKRIGTLLCLWSEVLVFVSLSAHIVAANSMPRYLVVIFPLYMILASMRPRSAAFVSTVVMLILLQATTFALWTTAWRFSV